MKEKNPWIGGLLNLLVPGLGVFYTGERGRGCSVFVGFIFLVVLCPFVVPLFVGLTIEATGASISISQTTMQGIVGIAIVLLWLAMFYGGYSFVKRYNDKLAASVPETKRPTEQEGPEAKLKKLQEMLSTGLITQEDYETKKADVLSRM